MLPLAVRRTYDIEAAQFLNDLLNYLLDVFLERHVSGNGD
jgi:hypothetical protein